MLGFDYQVYKTFKIVNNNIVIVKDSNGREMIAIGKGLGFKKNKNDIVYPDEIMKTYIYLDRQKNLNLALFEEVPFEVIEVSQHIIDYATKTLNQKYNVNLLVSLSDHIDFSVKQFKQGNNTAKLFNEEIKRFYKDEYQIGKYAVQYINKTLHVDLPRDEATSIAFHLIVASQEKTNIETRELLEGVNEIVNITVKYLGKPIDEDSLAYSRYIIHLKFFLSRIVSMSNQALHGNEKFSSIFGQLVTKYDQVEKCIQEISKLINEKFNYRCTDEDCIYLMVHIVRLYEQSQKGDSNE